MPKRKRRRSPVKKNPTPTRRRARRNPTARKVSRRVASAFGGLSFKKALKDLPAIQIGMFAAKWVAKRWGADYPATESDPESWSAMSYIKGALGAVGAAMLVNQFRRGAGQKVLEGGLNMMVFKALQNEVISKSEWATEQLGQDYAPTEYEGMLLAGEGADGSPLMLADDGELYPADDEYRFSDSLEPVSQLGFGDALEPVGPLGGDPYARVFQN
jgi:hypothetical protein